MFKLEKVPLQAVNAQFDVPECSVGIYEWKWLTMLKKYLFINAGKQVAETIRTTFFFTFQKYIIQLFESCGYDRRVGEIPLKVLFYDFDANFSLIFTTYLTDINLLKNFSWKNLSTDQLIQISVNFLLQVPS